MLGGPPLEQLRVGRHRGDGRTELVRRVSDELAQMVLGLLQAGLGGQPGRERRLNALQHDVERLGQATDLGGLLRARDALVEVAGGDGVRRSLDVLERPQPEANEPPPRREREHQRTGRHGELNQEEGVQRARLVTDRLGLHEDVTTAQLLCSHPERRASLRDRSSREVDGLGPVRLRGESRDGRRQ